MFMMACLSFCTCRDTCDTESLINISQLIYGVFVFEHFFWKLILLTWIFTPLWKSNINVLTPRATSAWLVPVHPKEYDSIRVGIWPCIIFLSSNDSDKILPNWQIVLKGQCIWSSNTTFWKRMRVIPFHYSMDLYAKNWRNLGCNSFSLDVCESVIITLTT